MALRARKLAGAFEKRAPEHDRQGILYILANRTLSLLQSMVKRRKVNLTHFLDESLVQEDKRILWRGALGGSENRKSAQKNAKKPETTSDFSQILKPQVHNKKPPYESCRQQDL